MKRRHLAWAAAALGTGTAGIFWQRRQESQSLATSTSRPTAASAAPVAGASAEATGSASGVPEAQDLWTQTLERVDGSPWPMAQLRGQALIINFWATWCPPCVREMPMLDRFAKEQAQAPGGKGWRLLGLAVDRREAVARYLAEHPVSYDIALASMEAIGWTRTLGNGSGGLPFSVAFGPQGQVLHQKVGEITEAELRSWPVPRT